MSGLRERLSRLRSDSSVEDRSDTLHEQEVSPPGGADGKTAPSMEDLSFQKLGIEKVDNEWGQFLLRRREYPFPHRHGHYELGELHGAAANLHPIAVRQNQSAETIDSIDAYRLLFMDTETTGLGVGTGNVPFMVGFGYYTPHSFVIEQTLIRHPGEEKAMLAYLLGRLMDKTHLVTYNGRTFDWPILVNRFILNGWRRSGADPAHLDFLHPSRALWRNSLPSCRLSIVEEARLGILREDDVPGAMAPALYFQYLSDGNPMHLYGVYEHNEKDVLTLASLSIHFGRLLDGSDKGEAARQLAGSEELFRTASWLEQHGNAGQAERLFALLDERPDLGEGQWGLALAARYKRSGQLLKAVRLWERFAAAAELGVLPKVDAHIELAIYYEHRDKKLTAALQYAEAALRLALRLPGSVRDKNGRRQEREALKRRIERLESKLSRS